MLISLTRPLPDGVGRVSQWFGSNAPAYKRFGLAGHNGIDYAVPLGTPILAAHDGVLVIGAPDPTGYGTFVKVRGEQIETLYAHLSALAEHQTGEHVNFGDCIGYSGSTGNSTGPHLHFGLRVIGMRNPAYSGWIDPVPFRDG